MAERPPILDETGADPWEAGLFRLGTLPMKTAVDIVGYGVQGFVRGRPWQIFLFTRYFAPSELIQSNNVHSGEFIKLTANPSNERQRLAACGS